jgi:predicted transglutaminase-like cysteine proteinase
LVSTGATGQEVTAHRSVDRSTVRASAFMRIYGPASPPHGFVRFCEKRPEECSADGGPESRFDASSDRLGELDDINRLINNAIAPATDLDVYGIKEYWTLPSTRGDCEDYALLKRRMLIGRGWPVSSLLLTVVRDEKGDGHAVLTARTKQGDFILDNKFVDIRLWTGAPYEFVMRQSYLNPQVWVALDARHTPVSTALSGVQD